MAIEKRYRIHCGASTRGPEGFFDLVCGWGEEHGQMVLVTAGYPDSRQPEDENVAFWVTREEGLELAAALYAALEIPLSSEQAALLGET